MWFCMAKSNKKSYKVVAIISTNDILEIATTKHIGYAIEIAKCFDEMYKTKGYEMMIEIR